MAVDRVSELKEKINSIKDFSGAILIKESNSVIIEEAYGFSDISNEIKNNINTRFGIASGTKILTAICICKLVDMGLLSFNSLVKDCLDIEFPNFNEEVTIHDLLTHSSGIPDYFDEEIMDDFSELWESTPMYLLREPKDFVPLLKDKMKFNPGEKFYYNNGGYIVLGLVIENISGMKYVDFVKENIFDKLEMNDSGFFPMDMLPKNCAYGYIEDFQGQLKTNIYSIPIMGGPDGGVFITISDMSKLWNGLLGCKLLSEEMTDRLLSPQIYVDKDIYYGYGVWIIKRETEVFKYYLTGADPGVRFISSVYPKESLEITIVSNREFGPYDISMFIEKYVEASKK